MGADAAGLRCLVVEDHGFQRRILAQVLRRLGAAEVVEAEDGEAALAALRAMPGAIDIVVTDFMLPGMDGAELMRRSGERGGAAFILVSALDTREREGVAARASQCGVRLLGSIDKPPTPAKLAPLLALYRQQAGAAARRPPGEPDALSDSPPAGPGA